MWTVKTELINKETELRKVYATSIYDTDIENIKTETYFTKGRMKTPEEKKAVWDNIWQQHLERTKVVSDPLGVEGKTDLEGRSP